MRVQIRPGAALLEKLSKLEKTHLNKTDKRQVRIAEITRAGQPLWMIYEGGEDIYLISRDELEKFEAVNGKPTKRDPVPGAPVR